MTEEVGLASSVVIINALVELIKLVDKEGKLNRFYPLFALAFGIGLAIWQEMTWFDGLLMGLAATGVYRGIKVVAKGE